MIVYLLRVKPEYWNFGKEPTPDSSTLKNRILKYYSDVKIVDDTKYPDEIVVAVAKKNSRKSIDKACGGIYDPTNVTSYLSKEGITTVKKILKT